MKHYQFLDDRRSFLKGISLGAAGLVFSPLLQKVAAQAAGTYVPPKRVIYFTFDNGWDAGGSIPEAIAPNTETTKQVSLAGLKLPADLEPFAPFQDRLTIVEGLQGRHCAMGHGSGYGALSGIAGSHNAPMGETIDSAVAKINPSVIPLLVLGIKAGSDQTTAYGISASGPGLPLPVHCRPEVAYESLFGRIGATRNDFLARKNLLDFITGDVRRLRTRIAGPEKDQLEYHLGALEALSKRDGQLSERFSKGQLAKHAPKMPETRPEKMTEIVAAQCDIAAAALISGLTNTVTISSGVGGINTLYTGISKAPTHQTGHFQTDPELNLTGLEVLSRYRSYLASQAAKILAKLQATPEGKGTMLDNTVLVFTSDCAETQHTNGAHWPFVLVGNLGGRIKSGNYLSYPLNAGGVGHKPLGTIPVRSVHGTAGKANPAINALYCTLLHAAGKPRDTFNSTGIAAPCGPLPELLA